MKKFYKLFTDYFWKYSIIIETHKADIQYLSEAFFIATFFLTFNKLLIGIFPFYINIIILIICTFYAYICFYYLQFQYLFACMIKKIMPQHMFKDRDVLIDDFIIEFQDSEELQRPWLNLKKIKQSQKICFYAFVYLIWLRLFFLYKPVFSSIIYTMVIFLLIFNKLAFFTPFYQFNNDIISCFV